jgi:hypothetical protein
MTAELRFCKGCRWFRAGDYTPICAHPTSGAHDGPDLVTGKTPLHARGPAKVLSVGEWALVTYAGKTASTGNRQRWDSHEQGHAVSGALGQLHGVRRQRGRLVMNYDRVLVAIFRLCDAPVRARSP